MGTDIANLAEGARRRAREWTKRRSFCESRDETKVRETARRDDERVPPRPYID